MSAVTVDANSGRFLIVPAQNTHTVNGPKKKMFMWWWRRWGSHSLDTSTGGEDPQSGR